MNQFIFDLAEEIANHSGRAVFVYRDNFNHKLYMGFSSRSLEITSIRFFPWFRERPQTGSAAQ
jgi:hypothetical protein